MHNCVHIDVHVPLIHNFVHTLYTKMCMMHICTKICFNTYTKLCIFDTQICVSLNFFLPRLYGNRQFKWGGSNLPPHPLPVLVLSLSPSYPPTSQAAITFSAYPFLTILLLPPPQLFPISSYRGLGNIYVISSRQSPAASLFCNFRQT